MTNKKEELKESIHELYDSFPSMSMCVNSQDFTNKTRELYFNICSKQAALIEELEKEIDLLEALVSCSDISNYF